MKDFKAIQTKYNGYRFRSRLEARWAVFFDVLDLRYEYEPEGFDFGNAGAYLPDFYLPTLKLYIEIKPSLEKEGDWIDKRAGELGGRLAEMTGKRVIIIAGTPGHIEFLHCTYEGFPCKKCSDSENSYCAFDNGYLWTECPKCGQIDIQYAARAGRVQCDCIKENDKNMIWDAPRILEAYGMAHSARFPRSMQNKSYKTTDFKD